MSQLRDKTNGCEWDKEQTFESIAPFTIEEAYEAIELFCDLERKLLQDTSFLSLKPLKVKLGFIFDVMKQVE